MTETADRNHADIAWQLFIAAACFASAGFAIMIIMAAASDVLSKEWAPHSDQGCCSQQLTYREQRLNDLQSQLVISRSRLKAYQSAIADPSHPLFASAREGIDEEQAELMSIDKSMRQLQVSAATKTLIPEALIYAGIVFTAGIALRIAIVIAYRETGKKLSRKPFAAVTLGLAILLTAVALFEQIMVSIVAVEKGHFFWHSYCVSPGVFIGSRILSLGLHLSLCCPLAVCIFATLKQSTPLTKMDLQDPDGSCGIGGYIQFLQISSMLGLAYIFLLVLPTSMVTIRPNTSWLYRLTPSAQIMVVASVITCNIRAAYRVRSRYRELVRESGSTYAEQAAKNNPVDPTTRFIGERWWALPAGVTAILSLGYWVFLKAGVIGSL